MDDPYVFLAPEGIPELSVPPGSVVLLWVFQRRWAHYLDRPYDHGVLWNRYEDGSLIPVLPGPGLRETLAMVSGLPALHLASSAADQPPAPSPPSPRHLTLLP